MIIKLDVPGASARLRLPGGWPGLAELAELADTLAESACRCPDCPRVTTSDILLALAGVAPAHLAAALRRLAGPEPAPTPVPGAAGGGLAALYEKHAAELAAIDEAYKAGPGRAPR